MTDHADPLEIANALEKAFNEDTISEVLRLSWLAKEALRALAARPVTPTVLVVDGATSLWIDGAKVAQWSRELSTDEVISLIENPWGMFKPASAPKFPTMLRKMWSGGEVQAWINEHWPTTPASAPEALTKPWAQKTALGKAPSLIIELETAAERFTRYSNDSIDGLLQEAADVIRALAAPTPGAPEADKPLPEPAGFVRLIGGGQSPIYTADQMRGYAADVLRHEYRKGFIDGQIDMRAAALAAPSTPAKDSAK